MSSLVLAKLPAASDEAKAKAAEAAAKTAWAGKVDAYKLCLLQDKVAAYVKKGKPAEAPKPVVKPVVKDAKPAVAPAATATGCVDPGPFVYTPNVAVAQVAPASAATVVVAPAKKP
jgi:hypothetical protein